MACPDVPGLAAQQKIIMRILVISNLPPWVLGGAENQVARLTEAWSVLGHKIEVAGHSIPDGVTLFGYQSITTHRISVIDTFGRVTRAISYLSSLTKLIIRIGNDFDAIYCRGLSDGAISICILKLLHITNLPVLACPINARGAGDASFIRSIPGWRYIVRVLKQHCTAINLIAPAIEFDLKEIGLVGPYLSRIPNGIPIGPEITRNQVSPIRRLIWTGRLTNQKGLDLLLSALKRVASTGRNFHLDIIGDGPQRSSLVEMTKELELNTRIHFTNAIKPEEIRQRLTHADVFVLPSRYEGMSNSALEAMEAGLPLLLTRCGGIDTYINTDLGWLCEPDTADDLFATLCKMLDECGTELLKKGRLCRALVEQEFEINSVASRNAVLLSQITNS